MASSLKERFARFLAINGIRFTGQMDRVVDVSLTRVGTFLPDDVVEETRGEVSRATVYRTLAWMVKADALRRVQYNGCDVLVVPAGEN